MPSLADWTDADAAGAAEQGWNVFEGEDGKPHIGADHDRPFFKDDAEALASVRNRAYTGYLLQVKALKIVDGASGNGGATP